MQATYLLGSRASYLTKGSIRRVDGKLEFDEHRSKTDMTMYVVSLTFVL